MIVESGFQCGWYDAEDLKVESRKSGDHARGFKVFRDDLLIVIEVFVVFDLRLGPFCLKNSVFREDEACLGRECQSGCWRMQPLLTTIAAIATHPGVIDLSSMRVASVFGPERRFPVTGGRGGLTWQVH